METILHTIIYWITNQNLKEMPIYAPRIITIKRQINELQWLTFVTPTLRGQGQEDPHKFRST